MDDSGPQGLGKPGVIPLRPLNVGELIDGAISTVRSHLGLMLGVSAVVGAVSQALGVLLTLPMLNRINEANRLLAANPLHLNQVWPDLALGAAVPFAIDLVAQAFLAGLLIVVVGKAVLGQRIGLAGAWREAKPRLFRLLGLTLVYLLLVLLGTMAFIVPGIWVFVVFALATPALVLERGKVGESMLRSQALVRGSWWRVFGVLLLALLVSILLGVLVQWPIDLLTGTDTMSGANPMAPVPVLTPASLWFTALGATIAGTISYPFVSAMTALLYIDRRMRVERMHVNLARAAGIEPPVR